MSFNEAKTRFELIDPVPQAKGYSTFQRQQLSHRRRHPLQPRQALHPPCVHPRLAAELGGQPVVSAVLGGKRAINVRQAKALGQRFGVSPAVFI
jgi:hypothetical protein